MVTPRYHPEIGGVERHVFEVARRIGASGKQVTVLCTDRTGQRPDVEVHDGVTVRRVRAWPSKRDYHFAPGIYREVARGRWDLVHVQSYHTFVAPLAMLAALRSRTPYLVTFHGGGHSSGVRLALRRVQRRVLRPLLARAERLVAVARFEVGLYGEELGFRPERFVLIPNGSELELPGQPLPAPPANGTLIASVGRLERYKGHHRVIAALPHLLERRPDARLWIAGSGPYEQELRRLADRLGVGGRVEIESVPSGNGAMATRLVAVSLVVLLSDFETHPLAALEALALDRPLLVSDTSGLGELAEQGVARSVSLDAGPEVVAEAMVAELDHPLVRGDVRLPTWDECAEGLLGLYQEIAAGGRR
jgi:glycosyltransferase involved in cell wall biosynthesis